MIEMTHRQTSVLVEQFENNALKCPWFCISVSRSYFANQFVNFEIELTSIINTTLSQAIGLLTNEF